MGIQPAFAADDVDFLAAWPVRLNRYPPHYRTTLAWSHLMHRSTFSAPCGNTYSAPLCVRLESFSGSNVPLPVEMVAEAAMDRLTMFRAMDVSQTP
jgi:hypothetical protein